MASVPASAAAGSIYFHKAGVDRATFISGAEVCEGLAGGVVVRPQTSYSADPIAAGVGGLLGGIAASRQRRAVVDSILRTCMADRGYRRVESSTLRKELARLDSGARLDRMHALATAADPDGVVLPR
ncbi:hypothetical protein [Glacieibacterium frigidum]|uniref:Uncharacterized protein n=1 Tax=Glacieibacterium frigidum TaxID=2593303 RepID=A0A552UFB9_9SPHN|nr:hypothetical protein [Glacieibacterium frigidum]TRW16915.1 hypothetical protein FMM06_01520 [Glacieibacterium frigidum]